MIPCGSSGAVSYTHLEVYKRQSQPYDQVLREIVDRDYADTHRAIAPLRRAADAVELDTGALTFEESLHLLLEPIRCV